MFQVKEEHGKIVMGPKKLISQPVGRPSQRKIGPSVPPKPINDAMILSPQDSLAQSGNRKGTGYFLQFEPPKAITESSRKRTAPSTGRSSRIPVRSPVKKGSSSQKANSNGTRTRSVSPKVLKKDNNNDVNMDLVAEKCSRTASEWGDNSETTIDNSLENAPSRLSSLEVHQQKHETIEPLTSKSNGVVYSKAGNTIPEDGLQKKADYLSIDQFAINKDSDTLREPVCSGGMIESQPCRDSDTLDLPSSSLTVRPMTSGEAQVRAFQHSLGCQGLDLTDDEERELDERGESETERDSLQLNVGNTSSPSATECTEIATSQQLPDTRTEEVSVTRSMASSWMDRLKEVRMYISLQYTHLSS